MTRREFAKLTALGVAAPAIHAQSTTQKARDLIGKTIAALGGDAFRQMRYRVQSGRAYSFYHEQLSGLAIARIYTKYLAADSTAPVKIVERQEFGRKQDEQVIFSEQGAWDVTFRGAKELPAERIDQFRNTALHDVFYILRNRLDEPGLEMDARGAEVVENQSTLTLDIYDAQGRSVNVWISATTFLPVRQRFERMDPVLHEKIPEVTNFTKYRDSGNGVMLPWATERERDGQRNFQMYADRVTVSQTIPDSMFQLPAGVQVIKSQSR